MASITAIMMKQDAQMPDPTHVYSFASPRFGDTEFVNFYDKEINQTSYEACLDLIPFLPPSQQTMENMEADMVEMING